MCAHAQTRMCTGMCIRAQGRHQEPGWEAAPLRASCARWCSQHTVGGPTMGWRCWHAAGTPAPPRCLHGLNNTLCPLCTLSRGNKRGGIHLNRKRTVFFSPLRDTTGASLRRVPGRWRTAMESRRPALPCPAAPARAEFTFSLNLGEFRFSKEEEGTKSGGKSHRALQAGHAPGSAGALQR